MNILPHKSWHVRTKKNIERVRRDEAKAAEQEKEKQRKIALAEQEARTDLLRKRSHNATSTAIEAPAEKVPRLTDNDNETEEATTSAVVATSGIYTDAGNINLFKELEAGDVAQGSNVEHEEEKKAEKEKWEKDIGLLTYLGQSAVEKQEDKPWYLSGIRKHRKEPVDPDVKDMKLKQSMDPLRQMESYLAKKHKHEHKDKKKSKEDKHRHKKKKEKDRERSKSDNHSKSSTSSSSKTIEQLRAERLKREQTERQRVRDMFSGEGQKVKDTERPVSDRDRGYNSVFNPEFIRKPKQRRRSYDFDKL